MRWFHLLHSFILVVLGTITLVALVSVISLLIPSLNTLPATRQDLSELLSTPSSPSLTSFKEPTNLVTLKYGSLTEATDSASLLRSVTPDEMLFLPVFRPVTLATNRSFSLIPYQTKLGMTWDEIKVRTWLADIAKDIDTGAQPPSVTFVSGKIPPFTIFRGKAGLGLNEKEALQTILRSSNLSFTVNGSSQAVDLPLTPEEVAAAEDRVTKLLTGPLSFTAQNKTFTLTPAKLARLITLPEGFSQAATAELITSWAKEFDVDVVEPELAFDGKVITTFRAPVSGRHLDQEKSRQLILSALAAREAGKETGSSELAVTVESPKISLDSLNNLGITERIGRGDSEYQHSIPNRIFNVALATSRLHGKIIEPGAVFSFNRTLGEVSAATGFKQAYVIDQGQTVMGDGGGVCQVSSTFFRALLDAGLPVLTRRGHSYRVGYYEQNSKPGFDATVSAPSPDLTFLNDTGAPILINAQTDSKRTRMYIELYGKSDGRKTEILNYKQWDSSPAPPPAYQDDPTLPAGVIKQIDFAAGGLKVSFEYRVTYPNGSLKDVTYQTTYTPWQARFLRGTGF